MSLHEDSAGSGYDTPVPELDDHRHQIPVTRGSDRPRRGTFDSLYAAAQLDDVAPGSLSRYDSHRAEEAVVDDDAGDQSPTSPRSRRPTVDSILSTNERGVSPPNSVKAFAEARRRDRGMSVSEDRADDAVSLHSTRSAQSKRSFISRRQTAQDSEAISIASNLTAEEDVCFPVQDEYNQSGLHIDYDVLAAFIASQEREDEIHTLERRASARSFPNLAQQQTADANGSAMVTADGDFIGSPALSREKVEGAGDCSSLKSESGGKAIAPTVIDPNRFSFFSSAWESTAHASTLGGLLFNEDLHHLFSFPKDDPDGVWWLNIAHPTEDEIRAICKAFGVHPLTVEDILTQEAREKIELFPFYYFASFRSFKIVEDDGEIEYEPFNIYVVVFREGTLSFTYQQNGHASHVRKRIAMLKDYVALSSDWICYALIDHIVDSFAPVIQKLEREIDTIEDEVFVARPEDMSEFLRKIGTARKQTMSLSRLLNGKADVLRGFTKRCNPDYRVTPRLDIGMYLGDIQDHIVTMHNNLQHFEKILTRTHSNYLGHLTIESIANGTKVNNVLSKITLVGSIIVPLNLVCGLFGMNVQVPFASHDGLEPFFSIVAFLFLFTVLLILVLRRWKYI